METAPVSESGRTLKVRSTKSADSSKSKPAKVVTVKRKPKTIVKPATPADVNDLIATAAYFIAQQRNFAPGNELADWLLAEQQILATHSPN
jgi:hypothetical protein